MDPDAPLQLLLVGMLVGSALIGNAVAVRHLPIENVPPLLRHRVEVCNRMRPFLAVAALMMTLSGLLLHLS